MMNGRILAAIFVVVLSISQGGIASARTGNFGNFTVEVPDDWEPMGPGGIQVRSPDGKLVILPAAGAYVLKGAKPNPDGSPDMDGILKYVQLLKEKLESNPSVSGFPMIQTFATRELGAYRSLMRAIYRMNPSTIIAQYYVIGPAYVAPFSVASKHDIAETIEKLDGIFASLKWIGPPQ